MNTKEIIAYVRAPGPAKNQSDVVDALIGDAKALITARRCTSIEAKRSCYMEQDTKFRSAFNKAKPDMEAMGWNEDSLLNHFKSRPDIREIVAPTSVKESPRGGLSNNTVFDLMYGDMRKSLERLQQYENAVNSLADHLIRLFDTSMEICVEDCSDLCKNFSVSDHHEVSTKTAIHKVGDGLVSVITTTKDRVDTAVMISKAVKQARRTRPEIQDMFEDNNQVLAFLVKTVKGFAGALTDAN